MVQICSAVCAGGRERATGAQSRPGREGKVPELRKADNGFSSSSPGTQPRSASPALPLTGSCWGNF